MFFLTVSMISAFSGNGSGTIADPFEITNCTQLQEMEDNLTVNYELMNEIDCSDTINWDSGNGFDPIGTFTGNLSGNGNNITNLYINRTDARTALFEYIGPNSNLQQIGIINFTIRNFNDAGVTKDVGSLFAFSLGNNFIDQIYSQGIFYIEGDDGFGEPYIGGIGGRTGNDDIISNCYTNIFYSESGTAYSYVGGITGLLDTDAIIENSYSILNGTSSGDIGGLSSWLKGTINNSFADGYYNATSSVNEGGISSLIVGGTMENTYWNNNSFNPPQCGPETPVSGCTAITDNSSYFKGKVYPNLEPMAKWEFYDIWDVRVENYPSLAWQGIGNNSLPQITINSPSNQNYTNAKILLNISTEIDFGEINSTWYNYNGTNYTYTTPINITFSQGITNLTVYSNNTYGEENSTSLTFNVDEQVYITYTVTRDVTNSSGVNLGFSTIRTSVTSMAGNLFSLTPQVGTVLSITIIIIALILLVFHIYKINQRDDFSG